MNKAELIEVVAHAADINIKDATAAVDAVLDIIKSAVAKGDTVSISGLGIFEKYERPAITGRIPHTGASVQIAAASVPKFRAGAEFKRIVSGGGDRFSRETGWKSLTFPFDSFTSVRRNQPGIVAYSWLNRSDDTLVADLETALNQMVNEAGIFDYAFGALGQRRIYYRPVYDLETLRELDTASSEYNASRAGRPHRFSDISDLRSRCPHVWGIYRIKRQDKSAYVGLATNLHARLMQHVRAGKLTFDQGDYVEVILAERSHASRLILWDNLAAAERVHIQKTKNEGFILDNTTDGGNGRTPNYGVNN